MGVAVAPPYGAWINTDATSQPLILMGAGGLVGIGTSSPTKQLTVKAPASNYAQFALSGGDSSTFWNLFAWNDNSKFAVAYNGTTPALTIDSTGNSTFTGALALDGYDFKVQRPTIPSFIGASLSNFTSKAYTTGTTFTTGSSIVSAASEVWSATAAGTYIDINTVTPTTLTSVKRVRINDTGLAVTGAVTATTLSTFSAGIALGNVASATATTLDYYEEGTHVAAITCGTSGTVTLDAAYDELSYTRIGNKMFVSGLLSVASVSSPVGYLNISLPVAASAGAATWAGPPITVQSVVSANISDFWATIDPSTAFISVYLGDATTIQSDSAEQMIVGSSFRISAQYTV